MLYNAAGLLALKEFNGSDRVQVQWAYSARDEKWKRDVVGMTMSALPIVVDFSRPGLDLLREVGAQTADNIAFSDLPFALYDNFPRQAGKPEHGFRGGGARDAAITPGTRGIPLWDHRHTSPADVECVLYPEVEKDRQVMFINYNRCCYDEASMRRFGKLLADGMQRLAGNDNCHRPGKRWR